MASRQAGKRAYHEQWGQGCLAGCLRSCLQLCLLALLPNQLVLLEGEGAMADESVGWCHSQLSKLQRPCRHHPWQR